MKQRKGTCDIDTFWEAVAEIGWGTKTTDYKVVEKAILENWDNEFIHSFDETMRKFRWELARKVEEFEDRNEVSCGCGDDGFSDLTHHVVGLGKEEYEAAMKDPMLVVKRGQKYDYTESFSYCIPHVPKAALQKEPMTFEQALEKAREIHGHVDEGDEDIELYLKGEALELMLGPKAKFDPRRYAFWAQRDLPDLESLAASSFKNELEPELGDVRTVLKQVAKGDLSLLFEQSNFGQKVKALREKRDAIYLEAQKRLEVLRGRGHSIDNMVSEARQYLIEEEDSAA